MKSIQHLYSAGKLCSAQKSMNIEYEVKQAGNVKSQKQYLDVSPEVKFKPDCVNDKWGPVFNVNSRIRRKSNMTS